MLTQAAPPPLARPAVLSRRESACYIGFLAALLLCWCPWKAAAYAAPALCMSCVIVVGRSAVAFRRLLVLTLTTAALILGHALFNPTFVLSSSLVAVATYMGLWVLWVLPGKDLENPRLLDRMTNATCVMVLLQSAVGIVQGIYGYVSAGSFDGANGDIVQGTIFPFLRGDGAFANPMYGASMSLMALSLVPGTYGKRRYALAVGLGAVALVLASVLHQLTYMALALGLAYLWARPRLRISRATALLLSVSGVSVLLTLALLPGNLATFADIINQFLEGHSPRSAIVDRVIYDMPENYPYMPVVGVGPGQFSSRAALMNTGFYFGSPLAPKDFSPVLRNAVPEPMRESLLPLWLRSSGNKYYGSSQRPYFGWLSVYTEFGGLGTLFAVAVIGLALWRLPRRAKGLYAGLLSFSCAGMILFVALIALQENYWEVPQAVLPGLLLVKAMHAQATRK